MGISFGVTKVSDIFFGLARCSSYFLKKKQPVDVGSKPKGSDQSCLDIKIHFVSFICTGSITASTFQPLINLTVQWPLKVNKGAKIRNRYNQVPHLTQDTNGKVTNSQLDTTNESQEAIPYQQVTTSH